MRSPGCTSSSSSGAIIASLSLALTWMKSSGGTAVRCPIAAGGTTAAAHRPTTDARNRCRRVAGRSRSPGRHRIPRVSPCRPPTAAAVAEHQRDMRIAGDEFDLRDVAARVQAVDQRAKNRRDLKPSCGTTTWRAPMSATKRGSCSRNPTRVLSSSRPGALRSALAAIAPAVAAQRRHTAWARHGRCVAGCPAVAAAWPRSAGSAKCCSTQPPQVPNGQRGSTRSGDAAITSSVFASSKCRERAVCCTLTVLPGRPRRRTRSCRCWHALRASA